MLNIFYPDIVEHSNTVEKWCVKKPIEGLWYNLIIQHFQDTIDKIMQKNEEVQVTKEINYIPNMFNHWAIQ